jgi:hypothetical protein
VATSIIAGLPASRIPAPAPPTLPPPPQLLLLLLLFILLVGEDNGSDFEVGDIGGDWEEECVAS